MHYLADQRGQAVGLLYQNILLDTYGTVVLGVILGNCVFDGRGAARAKYFRHTLFDMEGSILAKENGFVQHVKLDTTAVMQTAWEIIQTITDHQCPMIDPSENWSSVPVLEHFAGKPVLEAEMA
ncbi:hypothetical protein LZZ85_17070 [Terrimonas sp. NA20]|uniref:Uncharacterized protein n=1 Tax=Terrimonas ginsenosidimutans TaxID=2908004 RepID=A0ABS9KUI5_9BACT|nr:hypothetical protein [Terrimonas ginsenosidimutans]MCG2616012.1 hypothetical protein [Terrimonas ginsenosidimutans]